MDNKQVCKQLRGSLEFKRLWGDFLVTAVILSLFALFAVPRYSGEGWEIGRAHV